MSAAPCRRAARLGEHPAGCAFPDRGEQRTLLDFLARDVERQVGRATALLANSAPPAITMGAPPAAILTRMVRTSMLEELGQDYIRTARAKGLPE